MIACGGVTIRRTTSPVALLIIAALSATTPARARTTIVPDNFPTIQAAVNSVATKAPVETLLVRGGSYPERVSIINRRIVIQSIPPLDGSDRMPEIAELGAGSDVDGCAFIGIHFMGLVMVNPFGPNHLLFAGCRFDQGVSVMGRTGAALRITRCVLFKSVILHPRVATLDSSVIYGPVFMNASDSAFVLDNRFENIEYRALTVGGARTLVARNRVRGGGGFDARTGGDVRFEDNDIEGCRSGGFDIHASGHGHARLERNRIAHCGTFGFDSDGIRVHGRSLVRGNLVLDCRGSGILVDHGEGAAVVENNVIGRCDLAGISLTNPYAEFWLPVPEPATTSVRGNTVYGCGGPGIEISYLPGSTIANNLVYACGGLFASDSDPLLVSHNNWFPMLDPPISPSDLSVDPHFCDLAADDVRLRSDSPLLDVPDAGRIGALGQGCEPPPVAIAFHFSPQVLNLASRGRWVIGMLEPAAPFAASDIDVASVRLNGVPVDPAAPSALGDHDQNGIPDLTVRFSRVAVARTLEDGHGVTVTSLMRGRAFIGTESVRVTRAVDLAPVENGTSSDAMPSALAVRAASAASGPMRVEFALPEPGPARLELLDIAGRVIESAEVGERGPGRHSLELAPQGELRQGIYFLRLRQGVNEVRGRAAVIR